MSARRFVNMLVSDRRKSMYTLRRFDLSHNQFFYPTPEEAAEHAKVVPPLTGMPNKSTLTTNSSAGAGARAEEKKKKPIHIRPPAPMVNMKPSICATTSDKEWDKMDCFPLTETKLFFTDSSARIFRFDADTHCVVTMPNLHTPKYSPLALSIPPNPTTSEEGEGEGGGLYIMDRILRPNNKGQVQFEAIVYRRRYISNVNTSKAWHCDALPPPPFVHDPAYKPASICSYALVGGHTICISIRGVGTYCFDTVACEWSKAGNWLMPFHGRAEHDPELGLWFGVSDSNFHLPCAADISGVVRGEEPLPEHTRIWADTDVPKGWYPRPDCPTKVVSLGSGRFCVTNFFQTMFRDYRCDALLVNETFAVFTGMEVVLPGNGNVNGNDEGDFKGNSNGNGNDKGDCKGNANGNGNGLPGDGNGNGNDEGDFKGNSNGNGNGNDKGDCKGNANGNGNGFPGVRMIKHKSRSCRTHSSNLIKSVL